MQTGEDGLVDAERGGQNFNEADISWDLVSNWKD
jgi:hypothetical protein